MPDGKFTRQLTTLIARYILKSDMTYGAFLSGAPEYNPRSELITGKVCGIQAETIEDPLMKRVRQLD